MYYDESDCQMILDENNSPLSAWTLVGFCEVMAKFRIN